MRLSSISFTHASTAFFGLAVAGYAALRLAGYDVPHPDGHLALPAPSVVHRAPEPGLPAPGSGLPTETDPRVNRHPGIHDGQQTDADAETRHRLSWPRVAQESGEEGPSEQTDPEQPDLATDDYSGSDDSDEHGDEAGTDDAGTDDVAQGRSDDEAADR